MIELPADVLLIEPDERESDRYRALFTTGEGGACVSVATDADHAFELLEREADTCSPHLILIDLDHAEIDALNLVRRLRDDWRTRSIPIVALATDADEESALDAGRAGVSALITKPLDAENFIEAARAVSLYWRAWAHAADEALT